MNANEQQIIFKSLKETEQAQGVLQQIPAGYVEMQLSTQGKVGAPAVFHIRNFKMGELASLSLTNDDQLPSRVIKVLNDMIFEPVDVGFWHEKEVEELLVRLFMSFFRTKLTDIPFPLLPEDLAKIKEMPNGKEMLEAIKSRKYIPRTDIDLETGVELYDLDENFTSQVKITNKSTGFYVIFDFIHYHDQIIIKNWLDNYYKDQERAFAKVKAIRDHNMDLNNQLAEHPEKAEELIPLDPAAEEAYTEFLNQKLQTLAEMIRVISIVNVNGEDVSKLSASEKYERFINDPRIDFGMLAKLSKRQEKMKFGIRPEVTMVNPITQEVVKRPFSFQLFVILQAIQLSGPDNYDDGYDDED